MKINIMDKWWRKALNYHALCSDVWSVIWLCFITSSISLGIPGPGNSASVSVGRWPWKVSVRTQSSRWEVLLRTWTMAASSWSTSTTITLRCQLRRRNTSTLSTSKKISFRCLGSDYQICSSDWNVDWCYWPSITSYQKINQWTHLRTPQWPVMSIIT